MTDLVKAYWNCAWPADVTGHGELAFGDSAEIPRAEAEGSDHWRLSAPPKPKPRKPRAPRKPRKPKTTETATVDTPATPPPPATTEESD
jgi:hypothetical protein